MNEGKRLDRNQLLATIFYFVLFAVLGAFATPWLLLGSIACLLFVPIAWGDYRSHER